MHFDVRTRRKNGVEVRRDDHNFLFIHAAQLPDNVASLVDLSRQSRIRQQFLDRTCPLRFLKWRCGNFGNPRLLVVDPGNIRREPIKSGADSRVLREP